MVDLRYVGDATLPQSNPTCWPYFSTAAQHFALAGIFSSKVATSRAMAGSTRPVPNGARGGGGGGEGGGRNKNSGEIATAHSVAHPPVNDQLSPPGGTAASAAGGRSCPMLAEDDDSETCNSARSSARRGSLWQYPTTVPVWDDETQMLVLKVLTVPGAKYHVGDIASPVTELAATSDQMLLTSA